MSVRLDSPKASLRLDDLPGHVCPSCGGEVLRHTNADYCSRACKQRTESARRSEATAALCRGLTCPECGAGFDGANQRQVYCTPRCQGRSSDRRRAKPWSRERTCQECGKPFEAARIWQVYCSQRCQERARRKRRRAERRRFPGSRDA